MLYDYLKEFSVVAQEGTFSAAAARLNVSQPSLGRHISCLETELGTKLLHRGPTGVRLTEDGRTALATALDIATLEESIIRHFADDSRRRCERRLTVGMAYDLAAPVNLFSGVFQ